MSSLYIAVEIDNETKKELEKKQLILKQNSEDGDFEDSTKFHITVRFLADNEKDSHLAIEGLKLFEERYKSKRFTVEAKNFYNFEQGVSWVGVHNSMPLYKIKYQIEECLKEVGFPLKEDTHDGYTPHITMGYNVKENNNWNKEFKAISFIVDNISLWNGFKANDTYIHNKLYGVKLEDR
ncbi:MAG: RNA 2',3'-cyclic phosphodiesterase [archaeon]